MPARPNRTRRASERGEKDGQTSQTSTDNTEGQTDMSEQTTQQTDGKTDGQTDGQTAPEVELCGYVISTPKQGEKPCLKPKGHDVKDSELATEYGLGHSSRTFERTDLSAITVDAVTADTFAPDEKVTVLTDPDSRSDVQKSVDAQVKASYDAWLAYGKPATLMDAIKAKKPDGTPAEIARRFWLDPSQEKAYKVLLRSAATLHGVQVRMYPVQKHVSGRHMLPWVARDKREREETTNGQDEVVDLVAKLNAEVDALAEETGLDRDTVMAVVREVKDTTPDADKDTLMGALSAKLEEMADSDA